MPYADDGRFTVTLPADTHALREALQDVVNVLTAVETADGVGPHMTCTEAGIIGDLLELVAGEQAANAWLMGHALGDHDPADAHHDYYLMSEASVEEAP
jgi:hypothetical protein